MLILGERIDDGSSAPFGGERRKVPYETYVRHYIHTYGQTDIHTERGGKISETQKERAG